MNLGRASYRRGYRRSEEFQEEDIWNIIDQGREIGFKIDDEQQSPTPPRSISRRLPSAIKMIPRTGNRQDCDSDNGPKVMQHSAPLSIPDWPKIYGESPKGKDVSSSTSPQGHDHDNDIDDEYDGDDNGLHSHEWLAKKFARSQISSFSVCEGAGRTLKGRDLSNVRHAILSKTGFI